MKSIKSLVSVVMSCYNSENTLGSSIESILNQTYENIEFLIIDDASTDSTYEILKNYKENSKIKIFSNSYNLGLTKSLNILINNSSGEFIARHDADDISYKNRIEKQIFNMEKYNLDFSVTRATIKDNGRVIPRLSYNLPSKFVVRFKNPFIHGTLMLRKKSIEKINLYDENFYFSQDYKLISDMLNNDFKFKKIRTILYELNMKDNISTNKKAEQKYYALCVKNNLIPDPTFIKNL
ncbi:MAG: hypothetical protein CBE33_02280 [Candidatus Pelagibacter sp. TMED273]|nr:MAG: hypothetical protein CBE33_02280 [Candidatus Pelagibacter sp. TMED273]|tara:strand:+ start:14050 stop:14760 length:711 start_codon:yes stop_codon:yes gene_type:complete